MGGMGGWGDPVGDRRRAPGPEKIVFTPLFGALPFGARLNPQLVVEDMMICNECGALVIRPTVQLHTNWHAKIDPPLPKVTMKLADVAEPAKLLHAQLRHPGYEYETTEGPRKQWDEVDTPPEGEGWERNTDHGRNGWDRFDYTEESYWRRKKSDG